MPGFEIFGEEERKEVLDVLSTGVLFRYGFDAARKGHWKAKTFEEELCRMVGIKYAHMVSSGTTALVTALAACGVGAGDEVIVPPFTFVATFEAILFMGAVPVFADMDDTLCLDPVAAEKAITKRTRAVIPVHMCGSMAQIDKIAELCRRKNLILIEDSCQALGGTFHGKSLGTFGRVGCYSFDPVKTITAGEGGAVITDDDSLHERADQFADHGHDHIGNDRGAEGHPIVGINFRVSELTAAVALAQLRKLPRILEIQRANKKKIKEAMTDVPGVTFRRLPDPDGDSATFLTFFLPDEQSARAGAKELAKAGVDGVFYWYDNNWHYFRKWHHLKDRTFSARPVLDLLKKAPDYAAKDLPVSDYWMGRTICMQIKLSWTEKDMDERIAKIRSALGA
ncbi:MAG: DegT/DnrJ/EryC1/StrS family aminotransferase [Thermodesulfobacteriota bacterium]